jgi:hypothetical protein
LTIFKKDAIFHANSRPAEKTASINEAKRAGPGESRQFAHEAPQTGLLKRGFSPWLAIGQRAKIKKGGTAKASLSSLCRDEGLFIFFRKGVKK